MICINHMMRVIHHLHMSLFHNDMIDIRCWAVEPTTRTSHTM